MDSTQVPNPLDFPSDQRPWEQKGKHDCHVLLLDNGNSLQKHFKGYHWRSGWLVNSRKVSKNVGQLLLFKRKPKETVHQFSTPTQDPKLWTLELKQTSPPAAPTPGRVIWNMILAQLMEFTAPRPYSFLKSKSANSSSTCKKLNEAGRFSKTEPESSPVRVVR